MVDLLDEDGREGEGRNDLERLGEAEIDESHGFVKFSTLRVGGKADTIELQARYCFLAGWSNYVPSATLCLENLRYYSSSIVALSTANIGLQHNRKYTGPKWITMNPKLKLIDSR